ncbi:hypothetical protein K6V25_16035 [Bacteroides salyersiae]|uniref:hypothetical protein n=1 Tax=Bacteroides salyersiae TaxID=291644 RepID=UPI001CCD7DB4|nr:hypothetical protein [Bacteroides salyersiae]UBD64412.1 hypothetical protein K6V25_16035 [Bacteroides salyersiae]
MVKSIFCSLNPFKKKDKSDDTIIPPLGMKYIPTNTPYEDLWKKTGLSKYLDMNFADVYHIEFPTEKDSRENAYCDALIKVIERRKGEFLADSDSTKKNEIELRKFSIGLTTPDQTIKYRIDYADMFYDYISEGKKPGANKND